MLLAIALSALTSSADFPADVPTSDPSYEQVKLLYSGGALHTYSDGLFRGNRPATRYEVAWMFDAAFRMMNVKGITEGKPAFFPDFPTAGVPSDTTFPPNMLAALNRMSAIGVLHSYPDSLFRGGRTASKNELLIMTYRLATKTIKWNIESAAKMPVPEPEGKPGSTRDLDPTELEIALRTLRYLQVLPLEADGSYGGEKPATRYQVVTSLGRLVAWRILDSKGG